MSQIMQKENPTTTKTCVIQITEGIETKKRESD